MWHTFHWDVLHLVQNQLQKLGFLAQGNCMEGRKESPMPTGSLSENGRIDSHTYLWYHAVPPLLLGLQFHDNLLLGPDTQRINAHPPRPQRVKCVPTQWIYSGPRISTPSSTCCAPVSLMSNQLEVSTNSRIQGLDPIFGDGGILL